VSAFCGFLAFRLYLGHEPVLVGEEEQYVVDFQSPLDVPIGYPEGWAKALDIESRPGSCVVGVIVDEGCGGNNAKLLRKCGGQRLVVTELNEFVIRE
jgi:hypothetical protein